MRTVIFFLLSKHPPRADLPTSADRDFVTVELINQPGEFTWPIVAMSYIYVRKNLAFIESDEDKALLLAFLQSIYDPKCIDVCKDFGFTPVANNVRQLGLDGIAMLDIAPLFTFEDITQPNEGQGDYVISGKRRTYAEIERSDASGNIEAIMEDNQMLRLQLNNMQAVLVALETIVTDKAEKQAGGLHNIILDTILLRISVSSRLARRRSSITSWHSFGKPIIASTSRSWRNCSSRR